MSVLFKNAGGGGAGETFSPAARGTGGDSSCGARGAALRSCSERGWGAGHHKLLQ